MSLSQEFHAHGIRFQYPQGWELSEEPRDDTLTISVSDMGTFWSITILRRRPHPEQVLQEATEAFEDEYDDIDEEPASCMLNGIPAEAKTLEFVSLELINCVFMAAAQVGGKTLFIMTQVTDHERDEYEGIFKEMTASVQVDDDAEIEVN